MKPADEYTCHETALVDTGASIGKGTKIWHFSHISSGAVIGDNCVLGQNVFISKDVHIGDRVKVQNNVSVYDGVRLRDGVFCGPSMVFTNVINPRAFIERKHEFRETLVNQGATLGANCTIVCGVTIGEYALIGAGAVVTRDVADYSLVTGIPGKHSGWVSKSGIRLELPLSGDATALCPEGGERYQLTGDRVSVVD